MLKLAKVLFVGLTFKIKNKYIFLKYFEIEKVKSHSQITRFVFFYVHLNSFEPKTNYKKIKNIHLRTWKLGYQFPVRIYDNQ